MPRVGRRPGQRDTRAEIVQAARAAFAEEGYNGASLRGIARRAGVDPSLVHHYFADRADLYMAAMSLPFDPRAVQAEAYGEAASVGERLVAAFIGRWDRAQGTAGDFVTVAQAMTAAPAAVDAFREFLAERIWAQSAPTAPEDDTERSWRRALVSSLLLGSAWSRYVLRLEPMASAPVAEVARRVGAAIDRALAGEPGGV